MAYADALMRFRRAAITLPTALASAAIVAIAMGGLPRIASALPPSRAVVNVSPTGAVRTIQAALRVVDRGGTIIVQPGTYSDTTIVVGIPVTIIGRGWPVLDGANRRQIMTITADSVTVRGLRFRNVGVAFTQDLAAITVVRGRDCVIADNRIENGFFGIYLQEAERCRVEGNDLRASHARDAESGNGIHLWHSRDITIQG
ncbi:MAG TPA: right-handed parallel beta-helix repeat-containing protein, partial [Candidatus Elarobacter sp.]|nr:right-handed parallel beta-helix repeat-containing protein [Candidatus Elarobacter sp.]